MSVDMSNFITPKSDQLNADDLLAGPRTIRISGVRANEGSAEQPISISFDADNGKPYKPCKSMRRVMVYVWGANASAYIGRSMTVYCDPDVQFGGMKVGGIRISHMSHIDAPMTMALTATRARRAPFTVQPLVVTNMAALVAQFEAVTSRPAFDAAEAARSAVWKSLSRGDKGLLKAASDAAFERIKVAVAGPPEDADIDEITISDKPVDVDPDFSRSYDEHAQ